MVVSLSKFKYGKILPNEPRVLGREKARPKKVVDEDVVEEVARLRSSIDLIHELLEDISDLSTQVTDELYEVECSIENLEAQL